MSDPETIGYHAPCIREPMPRRPVGKTQTQHYFWDDELRLLWTETQGGHHDEAAARKNIATIEEIRRDLGLRKLRNVVDIRMLGSISRGARQVYAGETIARTLYASALWVDSRLTEVIANFFLMLSRPRTPHRMFTDVDDAVAWLQTFPED